MNSKVAPARESASPDHPMPIAPQQRFASMLWQLNVQLLRGEVGDYVHRGAVVLAGVGFVAASLALLRPVFQELRVPESLQAEHQIALPAVTPPRP